MLPPKTFCALFTLATLSFATTAASLPSYCGKPIIRGMRVSVELILSLLAQGETAETILTDYPGLERDDLRACLAYAHAVIAHDKLDAVQVGD